MRKKITISVNEELLEWIDKQVKEYGFGSRSHAFETGIFKMIQKT